MIKKWTIGLITALLFATQVSAQQTYVEGVDYKVISPVVRTSNPDKVTVTELFWYGCPHCFRFEPYIEHWAKTIPDGVEFEQVPSVSPSGDGELVPNWEVHARTYHALKLMGAQDQTHKKIFDAIHIKRKRLVNLDQMAKFVESLGLDEKRFRKEFGSFPVTFLIEKTAKMERQSGIGVPAIIINGKYLTSGSMAGSNDRLIKVIDYLVASELAL